MTVVDLAANAPTAEAKRQTSLALAQLAPTAKPVRKKVARRKVSPENRYAQIPNEWRHRHPQAGMYPQMGMAFARPFSW